MDLHWFGSSPEASYQALLISAVWGAEGMGPTVALLSAAGRAGLGLSSLRRHQAPWPCLILAFGRGQWAGRETEVVWKWEWCAPACRDVSQGV